MFVTHHSCQKAKPSESHTITYLGLLHPSRSCACASCLQLARYCLCARCSRFDLCGLCFCFSRDFCCALCALDCGSCCGFYSPIVHLLRGPLSPIVVAVKGAVSCVTSRVAIQKR